MKQREFLKYADGGVFIGGIAALASALPAAAILQKKRAARTQSIWK